MSCSVGIIFVYYLFHSQIIKFNLNHPKGKKTREERGREFIVSIEDTENIIIRNLASYTFDRFPFISNYFQQNAATCPMENFKETTAEQFTSFHSPISALCVLVILKWL